MVKPLLITGMHRSHTSLVCQWLNACGIPFGTNLKPANFSNTEGYLEHQSIVQFHNQILKELDVHFYPKKKIDYSKFNFTEKARKLKTLIDQQNTDIIAIKDPRAALFLEQLWLNVYPHLTMIFCYRDPYEVINSLMLREEKSYLSHNQIQQKILQSKWKLTKQKWVNRFAEAYVFYNQNILSTIKKYPKQSILINLEACLENDIKICNALTKSGFTCKPIGFNTVFKTQLTNKIVPEIPLDDTLKNKIELTYNELLKHQSHIFAE